MIDRAPCLPARRPSLAPPPLCYASSHCLPHFCAPLSLSSPGLHRARAVACPAPSPLSDVPHTLQRCGPAPLVPCPAPHIHCAAASCGRPAAA